MDNLKHHMNKAFYKGTRIHENDTILTYEYYGKAT